MITRVWHGWTNNENADAYETLLRTKILPGIFRVKGHLGTTLLRRELDDEVEFVTLTLWESMEAVEAFAGAGHVTAVVPPEARALLKRFDDHSVHYQTAQQAAALPQSPRECAPFARDPDHRGAESRLRLTAYSSAHHPK